MLMLGVQLSLYRLGGFRVPAVELLDFFGVQSSGISVAGVEGLRAQARMQGAFQRRPTWTSS